MKQFFLLIGYPKWWGTGREERNNNGCGCGEWLGNLGDFECSGTWRGVAVVANIRQETG